MMSFYVQEAFNVPTSRRHRLIKAKLKKLLSSPPSHPAAPETITLDKKTQSSTRKSCSSPFPLQNARPAP